MICRGANEEARREGRSYRVPAIRHRAASSPSAPLNAREGRNGSSETKISESSYHSRRRSVSRGGRGGGDLRSMGGPIVRRPTFERDVASEASMDQPLI